MKITFRAKFVAATAGLLMLVGCGNKPPECSDSAAIETLHKLMNTQATDAATSYGAQTSYDPRGIVPSYLATWGYTVSNISTRGYDEASHTRSCTAKVALTIPDTKQSGEVNFTYTLQTFQDSKGGAFELQADRDFVSLSRSTASTLADYYHHHIVLGTWAGISQCEPSKVDGVSDAELQQGFKILSATPDWIPDGPGERFPVELNVQDGQAVMTIGKPGGGTVVRKGTIDSKGELRFDWQHPDELSSFVQHLGAIHDDSFAPEMNMNAKKLGSRAKLKSNATGNELDAVLSRSCELHLAKK